MTLENFFDPRGEYKRICPYCKQAFVADHMNRIYCPEKNGIKNFCKHRFKRLKKELLEFGVEIKRPERPPLKLLFEPENKDYKNLDAEIAKTLLNRKIKILQDILGNQKSKLTNWKTLQNLGFKIDDQDRFIKNNFGTKSPIYGNIYLLWHTDNDIELIKQNKEDEPA